MMMMIKKFRKMNDVQTPYGSIFPHLTRESFQRKKKSTIGMNKLTLIL